MASMTYNDVELSIDLMDADVVERFENAVRECAEGVREKSQYEGKTTAQCASSAPVLTSSLTTLSVTALLQIFLVEGRTSVSIWMPSAWRTRAESRSLLRRTACSTNTRRTA